MLSDKSQVVVGRNNRLCIFLYYWAQWNWLSFNHASETEQKVCRHLESCSELSAVKACLIIVGARPTASQLVACIVTSLSYKPLTSHGKSRTAAVLSSLHWANAVRNCSAHGFAALMIENQSLRSMLTIYRTDCRWLLSVRSYMRNIVPWIRPKSSFLRLK